MIEIIEAVETQTPHCDGFEPCPFHMIEKDEDDWCTYCDQPDDDPPRTTCRCQL